MKPHPRYGTTHRLLWLIVILQLITIVASRGDMYVLGEAYAFGVVWSFVFKALAMVVLRFKDRNPREFKVPLNIRVRGVEVPIGLILVFLILLATAVLNFLTKEVASVAGTAFTAVFLTTFMLSERYHEKKRGSEAHRHLEQFNRRTADEFDPNLLGLSKPYRKLVAIRSSQNLYMLEKTILETDPETTDVVVMTAKIMLPGNMAINQGDFDHYDRELMTAVVNRAETIGKEVKALIMPTNNPLFAIINTAKILGAQELIIGRLEQVHRRRAIGAVGLLLDERRRREDDAADDSHSQPAARRLSRSCRRQSNPENQRTQGPLGRRAAFGRHRRQPRDAGSFRHGRQQRPVQGRADDARSPRRHDPGSACGQDRKPVKPAALGFSKTWSVRSNSGGKIDVCPLPQGEPAQEIVRLAAEQKFDVILIGKPSESSIEAGTPLDVDYIMEHAPCWVCVVSPKPIPNVADTAGS